MAYLDSVNDTFADAVYKTFGYQTKEMKAVVEAVRNYQQLPGPVQLGAIKQALRTWERTQPNEYRGRFGTIKAAFEQELNREEARMPVLEMGANMAWVQAQQQYLDAFKAFAVTDVLQFLGNTRHDARQDCLARYTDFSHSDPPRRGAPINIGFSLNTNWNANRCRMMYEFICYQNPRDIQYTPAANVNEVPQIGNGPRRIRSLGAGVCTQFAYAAAHALTANREGGPQLDIVSWMGGVQRAHCYVLVGRECDAPGGMLPMDLDEWGSDCVIVDAWLAALGHKVAYRITFSGDYPFMSFLMNARILMSRPFAPYVL